MAVLRQSARRGRNEGGIYQRKNGLWVGSIELPLGPDGKRRRKTFTSKDKAIVIRKMGALKSELQKLGDLPTKSMTLQAWIDYWLDHIAHRDRRPNTVKGYASVLTNHVAPALGTTRLENLTPKAIRDTTDTIAATRSSTYALNAHNVLSSCLKDAVRDGLIAHHPMEHMRRPRPNRREMEALTAEEARQVLRHQDKEKLGPLWATYLLTGARRNEVLGLTIDRATDKTLDLSWQLQRIKDPALIPADYDHQDLGRGYYLTRPKSSSGWRVIPMLPHLHTVLEWWRAEHRPDHLVFTGDDGRPLNPDTVSKEWLRMIKRAGIEKHVTLHGARHTVVDLLYAADVPEVVIQEILGHSARLVTRGYKSRGDSAAHAKAFGRMFELLG